MDTKTLADITAEIVENNTRLGWYVKCATFPEAMALLHSEVSEALEAWRHWGLADATYHATAAQAAIAREHNFCDGPPKPEGVGSEFADIFIRLLDDAWIFGKVDLEEVAGRGRFGIDDSFVVNMNTLHIMIAKASMAHGSGDWADEEGTRGSWTWRNQFGSILVFLGQLCGEYGIDLMAEYERKMAYNRTRAYRHGGKRI
jgi:hypothetical protein